MHKKAVCDFNVCGYSTTISSIIVTCVGRSKRPPMPFASSHRVLPTKRNKENKNCDVTECHIPLVLTITIIIFRKQKM